MQQVISPSTARSARAGAVNAPYAEMDPDPAPSSFVKRSPVGAHPCTVDTSSSVIVAEASSAVADDAENASGSAAYTGSAAAPWRASATSSGPDAASPVVEAPPAAAATLPQPAAGDSTWVASREWSVGEAATAAEKVDVACRRPAMDAAEATELELAAECGGFAVYRMRCFYMKSQQLHFVFIKMEGGALWIWVGDNNLMLHELEAAFPLKRQGKEEEGAVASTLLADNVDSRTKAVASKLAQRFSVPIFLSVSVRGLASDGLFQLFLQQLLQQQVSSLLCRAQPTPGSSSDSPTRCCCLSLNGALTAQHG